jgi:hypothetical protein
VDDVLSNGKGFPEVFKHMPPDKFVPLQEINWRKEYHLSRFIDKLLKSSYRIRIKEGKLKNLWLYNKDLRHIFHDIALIVSRINQDGVGINRMEELFNIANSRRWTDPEAEEMGNLDLIVDFFLLDVRSLLIFIMIFIDKLAGFLSLIINEKLSNDSFYHFKEDLAKLGGKEIEEFGQLINDNTAWFEKVRFLRNVFVVHHPGASGAMSFGNGKAYAALTTRKNISKEPKYIIMDSEATDISIKEVDGILRQLKKLLAILDEYLCSHINILPIEVEQRRARQNARAA